MRTNILTFFLALAGTIVLSGCGGKAQGTGLSVVYGNNGIEQLSYNGVVLEDLAQNPSDAFHIWHMKASNLQGKQVSGGQYGWGELNNGRTWDAATRTWKYLFSWGAISVQFSQAGDSLNMNVTETNNANSGATFDGATIYPFVLHFPQLPNGFSDPKFGHISTNSPGDSSPVADYGQGQVTSKVSGVSKPLYYGFEPAGGGFNYVPIISSTSMDSLTPSFTRFDRPVAPGQSDSFTVTLHFAPAGESGQ